MTSEGTADRPVIVEEVDGSATSIKTLRWPRRQLDPSERSSRPSHPGEYPARYGVSVGFGDWDPAADAYKIVDQAIAAALPRSEPGTENGFAEHARIEPILVNGVPQVHGGALRPDPDALEHGMSLSDRAGGYRTSEPHAPLHGERRSRTSLTIGHFAHVDPAPDLSSGSPRNID